MKAIEQETEKKAGMIAKVKSDEDIEILIRSTGQTQVEKASVLVFKTTGVSKAKIKEFKDKIKALR